ncbi:MAG: hypothetical protein ACRDNO_14860 [Trebonia sp.]
MNTTYLIYEAQRPRSMADQRETDMRAGEFAAALGRLGRSLRHRATGKQSARRGQRPVGATVTCAIPRPR